MIINKLLEIKDEEDLNRNVTNN